MDEIIVIAEIIGTLAGHAGAPSESLLMLPLCPGFSVGYMTVPASRAGTLIDTSFIFPYYSLGPGSAALCYRLLPSAFRLLLLRILLEWFSLRKV